jgi:hypothetical protein
MQEMGEKPAHMKIGRNASCPCGSGLKYKHCCLDKDEEKIRQEQEHAARMAENGVGGSSAVLNQAINRAVRTARANRKATRDSIDSKEKMEAGGVEPPSEKPCHPKTTCLSHSDGFATGTQSGQDAPAASPMSLAAALRTETRRPAYCVTLHPNRVDNDGGSAQLTLG